MAARPVLARLDVSTVAAGAGKQRLVHARRRRPPHAHSLPVPGTGGSAIRLACSSPFLGGKGSRRLKHNAAEGEAPPGPGHESAADLAAGALEDELQKKEHSGDAAAGTSPPSSRDNHSAPQQTEVTDDTNDSDKEKTNGPAQDALLGCNYGGASLEPGSGPHYN